VLIVDTGVLLVAADTSDPDHEARAELLANETGPLRTTALVLAETAYLIGRQLGPAAEAAFFRAVEALELEIETLTDDDLTRIADLVEKYVDLPLGGTDASVIAIAERFNETRVATLDRRHFAVVRPKHTQTFEIVP
jgi:predicted nucleic acid-binding protein